MSREIFGIIVTAASLLVVISLSLLDALSEQDSVIETIYRAFILLTCGFELIVATIAVLLAQVSESIPILSYIMTGSFLLGVVSLFTAVCVHETQKGLDGVWIVILVMGVIWLAIVAYFGIDRFLKRRESELQQ